MSEVSKIIQRTTYLCYIFLFMINCTLMGVFKDEGKQCITDKHRAGKAFIAHNPNIFSQSCIGTKNGIKLIHGMNPTQRASEKIEVKLECNFFSINHVLHIIFASAIIFIIHKFQEIFSILNSLII